MVKSVFSKSHEKSTHPISIDYIESSDKLLLVSGAEMKLVNRENGNFSTTYSPSFTLYPETLTSEIRLDVTQEQLKFLLRHIDWSLLPASSFSVIGAFLEKS